MNSYYDLLKRKHDAREFLIIVINFDFNENWYRNILRDVNTSALFRGYILIFSALFPHLLVQNAHSLIFKKLNSYPVRRRVRPRRSKNLGGATLETCEIENKRFIKYRENNIFTFILFSRTFISSSCYLSVILLKLNAN